MGKPRMIILIRHAQSEGNKNRDIHQMIPDHRVKLTDEGKRQAVEAGRRLRSMLKPDDTIQFFTSPYRRTRETTEGILSSLTASDDESGPSPFPRHTINVFEEPRLREQDFGNFQPCSTEMERMWQERADYGHFFYRIPNGESAADAYDRVSGFNESLWRNFNEPDFPSVCVLVTHGLMTRVFLMKWYHWSVEYFEDLRNVNHCEFVIMRQNLNNGKYLLENQLRTWSELKRKAANANASSTSLSSQAQAASSPSIPVRKWGGCQEGCNHHHSDFPRRRRNTQMQEMALPPPAEQIAEAEKEDHPIAVQQIDSSNTSGAAASSESSEPIETSNPPKHEESSGSTSEDKETDKSSANRLQLPIRSPIPHVSHPAYGRDAGGSLSGAATPAEGLSDIDSDGGSNNPYFFSALNNPRVSMNPSGFSGTQNAATASGRGSSGEKARPGKGVRRKPTEHDLEEWARQSGMGSGARADPLGDEADEDGDGDDEEGGEAETEQSLREVEKEENKDRSLRGSVY